VNRREEVSKTRCALTEYSLYTEDRKKILLLNVLLCISWEVINIQRNKQFVMRKVIKMYFDINIITNIEAKRKCWVHKIFIARTKQSVYRYRKFAI